MHTSRGGFLWANGATFISFKMMMNYKSEVFFKLSYPFFLSEMRLLEWLKASVEQSLFPSCYLLHVPLFCHDDKRLDDILKFAHTTSVEKLWPFHFFQHQHHKIKIWNELQSIPLKKYYTDQVPSFYSPFKRWIIKRYCCIYSHLRRPLQQCVGTKSK